MKVVVQEWERVLVYRDGRFETELAAGRHRLRRRRRQTVRVVLRPRLQAVPGQEVLTADGLTVKASLLVRTRVADARRWHETVDQPDGLVYGALQVALREQAADRTLDELLAARGELGAASEVGVALDRVDVRDLMVPGELRRAAAEAATARALGLAALERARGEVAATRALANAARLLTDNPGLLQLRTLQAVETGRAHVVLTQA